MTEQRKAPIESLRSQAESLGLSMHKSDSEGLYYLAKEEPVSGESRRIGPDMSPDDIAGFLTEETAVRAALRPTCWLAEMSTNIDRPYKSDTVSVIVEVVAKDADAPALAYEQASRFVATKYGATGGIPAKKPRVFRLRNPTASPTSTHLSRFPARFGSSARPMFDCNGTVTNSPLARIGSSRSRHVNQAGRSRACR